MYPIILTLHSFMRWVVLVFAVIAVGRALLRRGRPWTSGDDDAGKFLTIAFDVQFTLGVLLYAFLSPFTQAAFVNFSAAMGSPGLRFFAVEHLFGMVVAAGLIHVGRIKIRKASGDRRRHTLALIFFGLALLIMLGSIPWPGMPAARPLIRRF